MYLEKLKTFLLKYRELLSLGVIVIYYPTMIMEFRSKKMVNGSHGRWYTLSPFGMRWG